MTTSAALRDCRLYEFTTTDPRTNYETTRVGYIGETLRLPFERMIEHVLGKPWADTIVSWRVLPGVFAGKDAVWAAEKAAIEQARPLFNDEFNRSNPDRIEFEDAVRERWARDDAAGLPRWQPGQRVRPPARRALSERGPAAPARRPRSRLARWWADVRWPVLGYATAWSGLFVAAWFGLSRLDLPNSPAVSSVAATGALALGKFAMLSRRRRRQVVRLAATLLVGAGLLAGWLTQR